MNNLKNIIILAVVVVVQVCSCSPGVTTTAVSGADTVKLKYAKLLNIIKYDGCAITEISDPWNEGKKLHTYILVPDSMTGGDTTKKDSIANKVAEMLNINGATIVQTPLKRAVVTTSVHCGLIIKLDKKEAIRGVCDLKYINVPWIKAQCANGNIADCGNSMAPSIEKIIDINADAVLISPFQNSGGYGRLDEWGNPIIEMADYMETNALGRAEWMKFYGMLFGAEKQADSIFAEVEHNYQTLKDMAQNSSVRPSVIMDKAESGVWYVPGGQSTIGQMIIDANATYPFSYDKSSGSLQLTFETVLEKAGKADIWLYRHDEATQPSYGTLLSENHGYSQFTAFRKKNIYGCNTRETTFFEDTPFRPDMLLRDFVIIFHPDIKGLGTPHYYIKLR